MTDKQMLQTLHDSAQSHSDQTRNLQNAIKRLNTLKKDSDIKQQQQSLLKSLETFIKDLETLHRHATSTKKNIEKSLDEPKTPENDMQDGSKNESTQDKQKRLPLPEDQENIYHLKARRMSQYYSKNNALQAEVVLMSCRNELRAQRQQRQINYNRDTNLSAATTLHAIHMYEKRAKAAEARVEALQAELDEGRGTGGNKQNVSKSAGQNLLGTSFRVNDVIRRNEVLVNENRDQHLEIQRLKKDNTDLIRKSKNAEQDKHYMLNQLSTSEMARKDLYSRYQAQKAKHDKLSRSLTKQSADWIEARKQNEQVEEDIRWANVGHASPHSSHERTHMHPVPRNVDQPRYMYPVQQYAQPIKS